jgi:hypothetical protein
MSIEDSLDSLLFGIAAVFSTEIGFLRSISFSPPFIKERFLDPKEENLSLSGALFVEFLPLVF